MREICDDLNDPLDDLFNAAATGALTRTVEPPATYKPADYSEPCRKCGGSGRFRNFGPCFACKGKGQNTFKTSPAQRAKARERSTTHKLAKADEAVETFKSAHPAAYAWLLANVERFDFATSMWHALRTYGSLTEKQLAAVERLTAKAAADKVEAEARKANAPVITVERIEAAFTSARAAGLRKRLKLRLDTFVFKPAPAASSNPGAIYVTEGDEYLGKVVAGKFQATRACGDERTARVLAAAADPEKAAVAYGMRTGTCSCCGAELTNKESIERGIGPICAVKWGW